MELQKRANIKVKFHIFNTIKRDFILLRVQNLNILTDILHMCVCVNIRPEIQGQKEDSCPVLV